MPNTKIITFEELMPLKQMVKPALRTITRGINIPKSGISIEGHFEEVHIDKVKLSEFIQFFNFSTKNPMAFLYLLAQRVQAAILLQKDYSISIPGTIHLSNALIQHNEYDPNAAFSIVAKVEVDYKETGSLHPKFKVLLHQNNVLIAECSSGYLVKRKNKSGVKTIRTQPEIFQNPEHCFPINLSKYLGAEYADVSDDHNPIHKSKIAARLAGFKAPIIQGWYMISQSISLIELELNQKVITIKNDFHKPALLPSHSTLGVNASSFQIIGDENMDIQLIGHFKTKAK